MDGSGRKLETLVGGGAFFECPRWHDGRLWVSDYWRHQVVTIAPEGTTETVAEVPGSPSGLGWLPDGALLVVSMLDRKLLRVENGAVAEHADLSAHSGPQSNDMVVDAAGRAYVSTIDLPPPAGGGGPDPAGPHPHLPGGRPPRRPPLKGAGDR